MIFLSLK
ncbi:hypothetical protein VCCP103710_1206, partial [Vibrio cholerae CP1037(10)]